MAALRIRWRVVCGRLPAAFALVFVLAVIPACGPREGRSPQASSRELSSAEIDSLFQAGMNDLRGKRIYPGLWKLQCVLHEDSTHAGAHRTLGLHAYSTQDYATCARHLEVVAAARPLDPTEAATLGDSYNQEGRHQAADSLFAGLLEGAENLPRLLEARSFAKLKLGEIDSALAMAQRAVELDPSLESARLTLVELYQSRGEFAESGRVLAAAPPGRSVSASHGSAPRDSASREAASHGFAPRDSARFFVIHARAEDEAGHASAARAHYEAAIRVDPQNPDASFHLARLLKRTGDVEGARIAAERHRLALQAATTRTAARAMTELVNAAHEWESGRTEEAVRLLEAASASDPQEPHLRAALSVLAPRAGVAAADRSPAAPGAASDPRFIFLTARELRHRGTPQFAAKLFEAASQLLPGNAEAIYSWAIALAEAGDWNAATQAAAALERGAPGSGLDRGATP